MFQYDSAILERFPNTVGSVVIANDLMNQPSSDELKEQFALQQQQTLAVIGDTPLSDITSLSAWRSTFSAFGVNPTKTRSAPEALLRRLTKKGDIPSINTLVDIGNLISIRYQLPVAIFDTQALSGTLTVCFAEGHERYTELGSNELKHPEKGEVIFSDEADLVFARRWCWRQSLQSAAKLTTQNAIITIEAQHEQSHDVMKQAQSDLLQLLGSHAGGTYESKILDKHTSAW